MLMEILVLIAIVGGPFLGIWAQGKLDEKRQAKERKLDIFKTLMATRATPLSPEHVRALNRIDLEFNGGKEKEVQSAWNALVTHFGEGPKLPVSPPLPVLHRPNAKHMNKNPEPSRERVPLFRTVFQSSIGDGPCGFMIMLPG